MCVGVWGVGVGVCMWCGSFLSFLLLFVCLLVPYRKVSLNNYHVYKFVLTFYHHVDLI